MKGLDKMEKFICCLCGKEVEEYGNNPYPVDKIEVHKCCDDCNMNVVIPARLEL